jgi:hypothetical protein
VRKLIQTRCSNLLVLLSLLSFPVTFSPAAAAQSQTEPSTTWAITIVIPPKIVAGDSATFATLGVDGKLAPHINVELGNGQYIETDATGRAVFMVPKAGTFLVARATGASGVALIDPSDTQNAPTAIAVAPVLAVRDRFSICGSGFHGDAGKDRVEINGELALVLASSPECLVVAAGPKTLPGAATVSVQISTAKIDAATDLVSFSFEPSKTPFTAGTRNWLTLRAIGSEKRLNVVVRNETPEVIRFEKGDAQEVTTSGGKDNIASIRVEAARSGDFAFNAHLLPAPDPELAHRFLEAAAPLAPPDMQRNLKKMAADLARHPQNAAKMRLRLQQVLSTTMTGDLRTILEASFDAL